MRNCGMHPLGDFRNQGTSIFVSDCVGFHFQTFLEVINVFLISRNIQSKLKELYPLDTQVNPRYRCLISAVNTSRNCMIGSVFIYFFCTYKLCGEKTGMM